MPLLASLDILLMDRQQSLNSGDKSNSKIEFADADDKIATLDVQALLSKSEMLLSPRSGRVGFASWAAVNVGILFKQGSCAF